MDKRKRTIAAACIAVVAVIAVIAVALAMRPGEDGGDGGKPAVVVESQQQPTPQPQPDELAGQEQEDEQPAEEVPRSEAFASYAAALGEGNTVLSEGSDAEVDSADEVHARALSLLTAGIAEFRALPYHTEKSDDVDEVIARYFYSHPNIAYYVYNYTCEDKGSLDPDSLHLFSSESLGDGMYKAAFTLLDAGGSPAAYVDGYYDDGLSMYKFSDISMAGTAGGGS